MAFYLKADNDNKLKLVTNTRKLIWLIFPEKKCRNILSNLFTHSSFIADAPETK